MSGDALNALAELLDLGHADAVVVLAEHAWHLAEDAVDRVDDSDGWLSDISFQLGELHHRACVEAGVDPVALARRLVELELGSELDAFQPHATPACWARWGWPSTGG